MDTDNAEFLKREVINALAEFGNRDALQAAENMLSHSNPAIRREQIRFLAHYRSRYAGDSFSILKRGLEDPSILVREGALDTAMEIPDERCIPMAAAFLRSGSDLDSLKNAERRAQAARFIKLCKSQKADLLEPVLSLVTSERLFTPCRLEALDALSYEHGMGRVQEVLIAALASPDGAVRTFAARALAFVQDRAGVAQVLLQQMQDESDRPLFLSRLTALVGLGTAEATATLARLVKSDDLVVKELAVTGLRRNQATRYRDVLTQMWDAMPDPRAELTRVELEPFDPARAARVEERPSQAGSAGPRPLQRNVGPVRGGGPRSSPGGPPRPRPGDPPRPSSGRPPRPGGPPRPSSGGPSRPGGPPRPSSGGPSRPGGPPRPSAGGPPRPRPTGPPRRPDGPPPSR